MKERDHSKELGADGKLLKFMLDTHCGDVEWTQVIWTGYNGGVL
jgi:hypothetical protein